MIQGSLASPSLTGGFFTTDPSGKHKLILTLYNLNLFELTERILLRSSKWENRGSLYIQGLSALVLEKSYTIKS